MYLIIGQDNGSQIFHGGNGRNIINQTVPEVKRNQVGTILEDRRIIVLIIEFISVAVQRRENNGIGAHGPSLEMHHPYKFNLRICLAELFHFSIGKTASAHINLFQRLQCRELLIKRLFYLRQSVLAAAKICQFILCTHNFPKQFNRTVHSEIGVCRKKIIDLVRVGTVFQVYKFQMAEIP